MNAQQEINLLRALLSEAREKLERYANRQGKVRMKEKGGFVANPTPGAHYPCVQSVIDRIRKEERSPR